jgi:hypothetical protein
MAGGAGTQFGKGGMITKVIAAKRAARSGAHTVIASGREDDVILRLARGESLGTLLVSETQPLTARKQWLADHLQLNGKLFSTAAPSMHCGEGKSLLPSASLPCRASSNAAQPSPAECREIAEWRRDRARPGQLWQQRRTAHMRAAPARTSKTSSATSTSPRSSIATT